MNNTVQYVRTCVSNWPDEDETSSHTTEEQEKEDNSTTEPVKGDTPTTEQAKADNSAVCEQQADPVFPPLPSIGQQSCTPEPESPQREQESQEEETRESSRLSGSDAVQTKVATEDMGIFCFKALVYYLHGCAKVPTPSFTNEPYPVFVTWQTLSGGKLRGCIGNFNPKPLITALIQTTLDSALEDRRFAPITLQEVTDLSCTVSILTDFQEAANWSDWEIGVHGIRIYLETSDGTISATFLPEVAAEKGWDKLRTIHRLLKKGGYTKPLTVPLLNSLRVVRYRSEKVTVTFADYAQRVADNYRELRNNQP